MGYATLIGVLFLNPCQRSNDITNDMTHITQPDFTVDLLRFNIVFRNFAVDMNTSNIIRFVLLGIAWIATVGLLLTHTRQITPYILFIITASAIIIFVPVYKKYVRDGKNRK